MTDTLKVEDLSQQDVGESLKLILEDIAANPDTLKPLDPGLVERARSLVEGVEVDLDAPLSPLDE
ncbi:type II toxin-antitoxin system PrlF family antitoxin [Pseudomonas sp. NPDC088368]|uniref:type II toxin-antitoxin system PrlF family antitoxin n=1 Tax=Pseudomonas sp. NPDC088368 TaxID=3364453 RepID=UPI00381CC905